MPLNTPPSSIPGSDSAASRVVASGKTSSAPKIIALVLGLILLLAGLVGSVFLLRQRATVQTQAMDCQLYTFSVAVNGDVTATNTSQQTVLGQNVSITINGESAGIFTVPSLEPGQSVALGQVQVPETGIFNWTATGTSDCQSSGSYPATSASPTPTQVPTQPTSTPRPSATPTASPVGGTIANACNGSCSTDANCQAGLTCYLGSCRNPDNPPSSICANPTATPQTLPKSGAADYSSLLLIGGGIITLIGALILFTL